MLKIITNLVCPFIMLSLSNLSFTAGNKQPGISLPILFNANAVCSGVPELANERFQSYHKLVQISRMTDNASFTKMTDIYENNIAYSYSNPGYKPVPDQCPYTDNSNDLHDNTMYKEWCEETFDDGIYIYDAYKDIAFIIEYTQEQS